MKSKQEAEIDILKGIEKQDNAIIEAFVSDVFQNVESFVLAQGGTIEDAEDLMQDAMMGLFRIVKKKDFVLHKSVADYFFGIVKNLWYNKFRGKLEIVSHVEVEESKSNYENDENIEEVINKNERYALYEKYINKLDKDCKEIFELTNLGIDVSEIISRFNYTLAYFYKKKSLCKKELITKIKNDPKYNELIND
jgi:RNA polymerase sigma factor (sigma-70 family)